MSRQMSLMDYKAFYEHALYSREEIHNIVPSNIKSLRECHTICRVCGCKDDGTFVGLDEDQEFEFEPSIGSYRVLFQRTSLQFSFSSMPDMPVSICGTCCYKIKIFYLMTRQFIIGQNALRSSIAGFYRHRYAIEPPEQPDDRKMLKKQLALGMLPPLHESTRPIKDLIKDCCRQQPQIKRSYSTDIRMRAGVQNVYQNDQRNHGAMNRRMHDNGCQTARLNANSRFGANQCTSPGRKLPNQQRPAVQSSPALHRLERNAHSSNAQVRQCLFTPRSSRREPEAGVGIKHLTRTMSNPITKDSTLIAAPSKTVIPPSKAQQQQKSKERTVRWR